MKKIITLLLATTLISTAAEAGKQSKILPSTRATIETDPDRLRMAYVEANVIATMYHEFAHALIDMLNLPVFSREEDAADAFVPVITDRHFDAGRAEQITWASLDQYKRDAEESAKYGGDTDYSDVHSLDMVRYYNLACLYYGGNPRRRDDFATENGLPEDRAETCREEREIAEFSWGGVLEDIKREQQGADWITIRNVDEARNPFITAAQDVIRSEVSKLNRLYAPGFTIKVDLINCDEENAYYQPNDGVILMCNELSRSYVHY